MAISTKSARDLLKSTGDILKGAASELLASSDFISRTIGMNNSYEDIMLLVQALGRQPVSLLGKDYLFIFDHVRRNYQQGTTIASTMYGGGDYWCPKFTFYKEKPTVRFADPYNDPLNLLDRWMPDFTPNTTMSEKTNMFYAESNDGVTNNKSISMADSNLGTATGQYSTSFQNLGTCDLIKKTNDNFNAGKYNTLVARFHTNSMDSRDPENPTQTAISKAYGMSHGRNLLKINPDEPNGYNNPYCRVWTYHHQYHRMVDAIRPFGDAHSKEELENLELSGDYDTVGFRTIESKNYGIDGGSRRLDKHGVLNYDNGFVNIAPTAKIKDYFEHKADDKDRKSVSTKRCMFSIENLAWRDKKMKYDQFEAYGLSAEQRGPLGGRIMWFPPYDINFSENVSVKWNSNEFIGRGENIYTYTNTERRGNLSFTLLIDHPAILDYWTGHERNGMKNQGMALLPGNTDGVDGKDNQEQTLLRFFAGCDVLTAKPQEYWMRDKTPENQPEPPAKLDVPEPNPPKPDEAKPVKKKIVAILYYPNNYSGKDDRGGIVNPVHYLMNGIGTQKFARDEFGTPQDFYADVKHKTNLNGTLGYEMSDLGISYVAEALEPNYNIIKSTYNYTESAQFITTGGGNKVKGYYISGETLPDDAYLAKIVGSKAMGLELARNQKNLTGASHLWYRKRYYYRCDKAYENQDFSRPTSYIDGKSYQLNSSGYNKVRQHSNTIKEFGLEDDSDSFKLISFADLFEALEGDSVISDKADENNVKLVKKVLENKDTFKLKISFNGHASYQGRKNTNNDLAKNRAITLKWWLQKSKDMSGVEMSEPNIKNQPLKTEINVGEQDEELVKIWRSASVILEYEEIQTDLANNIDSAVEIETDSSGKITPVTSTTSGYTLNKVDTVQSSPSKVVSPGKIASAREWLHNTEEGKKILRDGVPTPVSFRNADGTITEKIVNMPVNEATFSMADAERITGKNYTNTAATNYDDSYLNQGITVTSSTVKRYDNEGEFFELLDKESPFLHHLITDKIKYFDPAFHSISPEGFNARLTFLHQCTRQGATIGNSDPNVQTAYNLAFGRPPVCVLRIGDFYYTKIIINSLTINYDSPQWDLNPEGIGVMPMFAKINIDFNFIGGSDLAGPIARLQNAVSFNYYANTGVYDNRAEKVEYDPTGTGKETNYKPYNYPNGPGRRKVGIENIGTGEFLKTDREGEWEDV